MTKQISTPLQRKIFLAAYATGNTETSPDYAMVVVDQAFKDTLLKLQTICIQNKLSQLRVTMNPDFWEHEEELTLTNGEIVIDSREFYFIDCINNQDSDVETRALSIDSIINLDLSEVEPVYFPQELQESVEADQ